MNEGMARIGLKVKLIKVNKTRELHGCNSRMEVMIGDTFTISNVFRSSAANTGEQTTQIKFLEDGADYVWAPEDVQYKNNKVIKPKGGKFDPSNLIY